MPLIKKDEPFPPEPLNNRNRTTMSESMRPVRDKIVAMKKKRESKLLYKFSQLLKRIYHAVI